MSNALATIGGTSTAAKKIAIPANVPGRISLADKLRLDFAGDAIGTAINMAYEGSQYVEKNTDARRIAFVTLATPDYDIGARILIRSLRRFSDAPVFVMMLSEWSFITDEPDVFTIAVPELRRPTDAKRAEFAATFTKFWAFALLGLERIVFIDSDCLVTGDIEPLFEGEAFLACRDSVERVRTDIFNSGVMAFSPSFEQWNRIVTGAATAESYDGGDQGVLNTLFRNSVKFVPSEFNTLKHYPYFRAAEVDQTQIRCIHYIVKKPWEIWYREISDSFAVDLEDRWTRELTHDELLALVSHWRRTQFLAERGRFDVTRQSPRKKRKQTQTAIAIAASVILLFVLGAVFGSVMHP